MFTLIKFSLLSKFRERAWVIFNALFPIFLMLLIGTMVQNAMITERNLSKTTVYYYDSSSKEAQQIFDYTKNAFDEDMFVFEEIKDIEEGKRKVELDKSIFLNLNNNDIEVYSSEINTSKTAILISTIKSVNKSVVVIKDMFKINPSLAMELTSSYNENHDIKVEYVAKTKAPSSYDYYGVVELTMMILYIMMFALSEIEDERKNNIKDRICLIESNRFKYYTAKIIATFILSIVVILPGFIFSLVVLNTNWGPNPLVSFLYVLSFAAMTCTVGTLIGILFKDYERSMALIQGLIIPVLSFLGGAYIAIGDNLKGIFKYVTLISPLRWLNMGLFRMIYNGDYGMLNNALFLNTLIIFIGFLIIFRVAKREEVA